ncbi:Ribosomal large subunit pseudouridine synthase E [Marinomonas aquimarina]|uniref:Pseudouridine synthase n=1 Tax=Marinomonas aquimarina TaxID=295068 RepID=A0A1A8T6Q9_9GAMM|nr:pseudouridine synthase [Marinomonas aquimarina]SBS26798.1 Ribosomal large subunit pseudouridine synthase E [Marinomonas aquimarina]
MLLLLNKPFQVLSQFSADGDKDTLASYINVPNVYPAGRLDYDSEGLLLLTDQGALQHLIASPKFKMPKTYWVQVEGDISEQAIQALAQGVELKDGMTKPAQCRRMDTPDVWDRVPPIRERSNIPTSWIELTISEGKNRQVRRMTAHVGYPTLRLIRAAIGPYSIENVPVGTHIQVDLTDTLAQQVQHFEREKARKSASPNRRRSSHGQAALPHGKRNARRSDRAQSASRARGKR